MKRRSFFARAVAGLAALLSLSGFKPKEEIGFYVTEPLFDSRQHHVMISRIDIFNDRKYEEDMHFTMAVDLRSFLDKRGREYCDIPHAEWKDTEKRLRARMTQYVNEMQRRLGDPP